MAQVIERCEGAACRLRAGDCELPPAEARSSGCLRRCDAPVAAHAAGRALTIVARGRVERWRAPPLPPQPGVPVLLRDAALADQPELSAARRRGAYATLPTLEAARARALMALVARGGFDGEGAFAARVLCERDPHLVVEGLAIAARAAGATPRVPPALAAAAAAARECVGAVVVTSGGGDGTRAGTVGDAELVRAARLVRAAALGDAWGRHATTLCAVSGDVLRPGLYELDDDATIAVALAAAGGVVDGVRVAAAGAVRADGVATRDFAAPAPVALVAYHARRDPIC